MDERRQAWTVEDLEVFKRAYALSLAVHRTSLDFPKIEQYGGLADQLRRASKSVCGLLAEGAGRQHDSPREFARYVTMAMGSAEEARLWCRYAADLGYADAAIAAAWQEEFSQVIRMLHGLRGYAQRRSQF